MNLSFNIELKLSYYIMNASNFHTTGTLGSHRVANERKNEALVSVKFRILAACFVHLLMVYSSFSGGSAHYSAFVGCS
jgi:hypothetical protein